MGEIRICLGCGATICPSCTDDVCTFCGAILDENDDKKKAKKNRDKKEIKNKQPLNTWPSSVVK